MSQQTQSRTTMPADTSINAEHRVQIGLLRALEKALVALNSHESAAEILAQLTMYTSAHFLSEQLLMRLQGYEPYEAHCQEHDQLMESVMGLQKSMGNQAPDQVMNAFRRFEDCIVRHMDGARLSRPRTTHASRFPPLLGRNSRPGTR